MEIIVLWVAYRPLAHAVFQVSEGDISVLGLHGRADIDDGGLGSGLWNGNAGTARSVVGVQLGTWNAQSVQLSHDGVAGCVTQPDGNLQCGFPRQPPPL